MTVYGKAPGQSIREGVRAGYYILLSSLHARRCNESGRPGEAPTLAARIDFRLCRVRSVHRDSLAVESGEAHSSLYIGGCDGLLQKSNLSVSPLAGPAAAENTLTTKYSRPARERK